MQLTHNGNLLLIKISVSRVKKANQIKYSALSERWSKSSYNKLNKCACTSHVLREIKTTSNSVVSWKGGGFFKTGRTAEIQLELKFEPFRTSCRGLFLCSNKKTFFSILFLLTQLLKQGHRTTVFCKISVRRSKKQLEFSMA